MGTGSPFEGAGLRSRGLRPHSKTACFSTEQRHMHPAVVDDGQQWFGYV